MVSNECVGTACALVALASAVNREGNASVSFITDLLEEYLLHLRRSGQFTNVENRTWTSFLTS
jgi:hypothetical protein